MDKDLSPVEALTLHVGRGFTLYLEDPELDGGDLGPQSMWTITRIEDGEGWVPRIYVTGAVALA